jgi:hypothetical protein
MGSMILKATGAFWIIALYDKRESKCAFFAGETNQAPWEMTENLQGRIRSAVYKVCDVI